MNDKESMKILNSSIIEFHNADIPYIKYNKRSKLLEIDNNMRQGVLKLETNKYDVINSHYVFDVIVAVSNLKKDQPMLINELKSMISILSKVSVTLDIKLRIRILLDNDEIIIIDEYLSNGKRYILHNILDTSQLISSPVKLSQIITNVNHNKNVELDKDNSVIFTSIVITDGIGIINDIDVEGDDNNSESKDVYFYNRMIFIGIGNYLQELEKIIQYNSYKPYKYYYIDLLESTQLVLMEIIGNTLYKIAEDILIEIINGYIYNYENNTWCNKLRVNELISNSKRIFHICSKSDISDINCNIYGYSLLKDKYNCNLIEENIRVLPPLLYLGTNMLMETDLSVYILKQYTQQILYNLYIETDDNIEDVKNFLVNYKNYLYEYTNEHELEYNILYTNLIKNITIALEIYGTPLNKLYLYSRLQSEGWEEVYSVSKYFRREYIVGNNNDSIYLKNIIPLDDIDMTAINKVIRISHKNANTDRSRNRDNIILDYSELNTAPKLKRQRIMYDNSHVESLDISVRYNMPSNITKEKLELLNY